MGGHRVFFDEGRAVSKNEGVSGEGRGIGERRPRAVVLGAGLTGLAAAWKLAEAGVDVTVVEGEARVGGMSASIDYEGYRFDYGPHGFHSADERLIELFVDLVEGRYLKIQKHSEIYFKGRFFNYPLRLRDMHPSTVARGLASWFFTWSKGLARGHPTETAEDWVLSRCGRVLTDEFFGPLTSKVWGRGLDELHVHFMQDRLPFTSLWMEALKIVFRGKTVSKTPSGRPVLHDIVSFLYPSDGISILPEALRDRIVGAGGRVMLGAPVRGIDSVARSVVLDSKAPDRPEILPYDTLVSTIPLDALVHALGHEAPPSVQEAASGLAYRALVFVNLCVDRPEVLGPQWIYFTETMFNRVTETTRFSPSNAPPGKSGLTIEVGCTEGDGIWRAADDEIAGMVVRELAGVGLVRKAWIEDVMISRAAHAYPIYDLDYVDKKERILGHLRGIGDIHTCGRQGEFSYFNMDQAILSGMRTAERVLAGLRSQGRRP